MCGYDPKHQFANFIFIEPKYKEVKAELLKSRDKIATLEKDIENLGNNNLEMIKYVSETIDTIADSALKGIGEKLKLSTDERLSLYIHNDVSQFTIVGRYSPNKKYDRRNRATFCDEQGCIGNAWDKGVCFEPSLPKDKTIRNGLFKKKYNVPIKVSKTLKMPSKFYYCKRIDDSSDSQCGGIAIFVFESTKAGLYRQNELESILEENNVEKDLLRFIKVFKKFIPDGAFANKYGI